MGGMELVALIGVLTVQGVFVLCLVDVMRQEAELIRREIRSVQWAIGK